MFLNLDINRLFLIVLIFFPKVNIISLSGYWQGIRIEDLLIFFFSLKVLINQKNNVIFYNFNIWKDWYLFLNYLVLVNLISIINQINLEVIVLLRIFEYIALLIFFDHIKFNLKFVKKILIIYLVINLVLSYLQHLSLIGAISSLGYISSKDILNLRSSGITGGSWELSVLVGLSSLIFFKIEKSIKENLIFNLGIIIILLFTQSRMPLIAYAFTWIFLIGAYTKSFIIKNYLKTLLIIIVILIVARYLQIYRFSGGIYSETNYNFISSFFINLKVISKMLTDFIFYQEVPAIADLKDYPIQYWSLIYRLQHWNDILMININNPYTFIIGSGFTKIYTESLYITLILGTGIIGTIWVLYILRKIEIHILIYFLLAGFTLDLFISMKIFLFTLIYIKVNYLVNCEKKHGINDISILPKNK